MIRTNLFFPGNAHQEAAVRRHVIRVNDVGHLGRGNPRAEQFTCGAVREDVRGDVHGTVISTPAGDR